MQSIFHFDSRTITGSPSITDQVSISQAKKHPFGRNHGRGTIQIVRGYNLTNARSPQSSWFEWFCMGPDSKWITTSVRIHSPANVSEAVHDAHETSLSRSTAVHEQDLRRMHQREKTIRWQMFLIVTNRSIDHRHTFLDCYEQINRRMLPPLFSTPPPPPASPPTSCPRLLPSRGPLSSVLPPPELSYHRKHCPSWTPQTKHPSRHPPHQSAWSESVVAPLQRSPAMAPVGRPPPAPRAPASNRCPDRLHRRAVAHPRRAIAAPAGPPPLSANLSPFPPFRRAHALPPSFLIASLLLLLHTLHLCVVSPLTLAAELLCCIGVDQLDARLERRRKL